MVTILQQRIKDVAHRWMESSPKTFPIHKPLLQCRSDPNAPPPYWENDPNLRVLRYGPRIQQEEIFYCKGGVNVAQLLLFSRRSLFEVAYNSGANVLLNERWDCTISKSIIRYREHFRVQISYSAVVAEAEGKDPQKVARMEDARRIGDLMIVLMRR